MKKMIEVRSVNKAYKNNVLFQNIDLEVNVGDICGIVGKNGSGKSVLLKMLCGLVSPDSGQIYICQEEIGPNNFPKDIGVILDCAGFLPSYTGLENLEMIAKIRKKVDVDTLRKVMLSVGLDPDSKVKVGKYSLGMKQRLAFAQAIMEKPTLLILDEPTNGIDIETQKELREILKGKDENVTIILTSHNEEDISQLCNHVYKIEGKKLKLVY